MTQSLLKSRLLVSARSAPEQLQSDFEAQCTEFILYSDIGYLAIAQSLDEALGLLEESLASKKRTLPYVLHDKYVKIENGIVFLPLYMTPLL